MISRRGLSFLFLHAVLLSTSISLVKARSLLKKGDEKKRRRVDANNQPSSCQKYVLLTNQRSGSTWTCNLLDLQNRVTCGGTEMYQGIVRIPELMIQKHSSLINIEVKWSDYKTNLTRAFQNAMDANEYCNSESNPSMRAAAGFKMMYGQIPNQFIKGGEIFDYFAKNNIAVIHLVREAKILRLASMKQTRDIAGQEPHAIDASAVQKFREKTQSITWDDKTIAKIILEEMVDRKWEKRLIFKPHLKYHRLTYEKMLEKNSLISELIQVFTTLSTIQKPSSLNLDSKLLKLNESTCKGRINNYEELQKRLAGTRTLAACKMLDYLYGDAEAIPVRE